MTVSTPADIVALALVHAGVVGQGQIGAPEDTNNAFDILNMMLSQWSRKRWLVYHLIDVSKVTTGAQSYTLGPGGDFNTPRTDRIESAFVRQLLPGGQNQPDYPLEILQSREDYNQIALKTMGTWPSVLFYDSGYPMGAVYVWPLPAASQFEVHLSLKQPLTQFASLAQDIVLPPEYIPALFYNLAARLRPAYGMGPDPTITAMAKDALNVLRGANTQIATLRMPGTLVGQARMYNVFSDGR
jgi:hypothetical protein